MSTYNFFSLKKGLVDGTAKGKLDDDYKSKCLKLDNCFIKPNGNIATRPGLKQAPLGDGILDINIRGEKTYVLRKPEASTFSPNIGTFIDNTEGSKFAITIPWGTGSSSKVFGTFNNILDWTAVDVYDKNNNRLNEECHLFYSIKSSSIIDAVEESLLTNSPLLRYTATGATTADERAVNYRGAFFDSNATEKTWFSDRLRGVSHMLSTFHNILNNTQTYNINPSPAVTAQYSAISQSINTPAAIAKVGRFINHLQNQVALCNQVDEMSYVFIFKNPYDTFTPVYQGVANVPGFDLSLIDNTEFKTNKNILVDTMHLSISHFKTNFFTSLNRNLTREFKTHFSNRIEVPKKFEDREKGAGFTAFGYNYTLANKLICENSKSTFFSVDSLNETNMQSFSEKVKDIDINNLSINVKQFIPYYELLDIDIGTVKPVSTNNDYSIADNKFSRSNYSTLEELLIDRPELTEIKNKLDVVLTITKQTQVAYPVNGPLLSVLPDIKVTIPGTDVEAAGTHLFTTRQGDHIFVGPQTNLYYNQFKDQDNEDKYKLAQQPSQTDATKYFTR